MPRTRFGLVLALASTALLACGGGITHQLTTLARSDLGCDQNLMFTKMDEHTRVASGCGKEAEYTETCDANDECTWSRSSEVRRAQ